MYEHICDKSFLLCKGLKPCFKMHRFIEKKIEEYASSHMIASVQKVFKCSEWILILLTKMKAYEIKTPQRLFPVVKPADQNIYEMIKTSVVVH